MPLPVWPTSKSNNADRRDTSTTVATFRVTTSSLYMYLGTVYNLYCTVVLLYQNNPGRVRPVLSRTCTGAPAQAYRSETIRATSTLRPGFKE